MKNYKDLEIGNDLKQLLIGSLLGDGCFCFLVKHTKNMCLSIAHSEKQKEYIKYKWNILNKYNLVSPIVEYHINNKRYLVTESCRNVKAYIDNKGELAVEKLLL